VIYLRKLLPLLLSPIVVVLALVLVGAWRRSRAVLVAAALLLWTLSTRVIVDALLRAVEGHRVRLEAATMPKADAVVVLSGMLMHVQGEKGLVSEWGDAADRLFGGLELMQADKAPRLVLTRGLLPWQGKIRTEGESLREIAIAAGVPAEKILLTPPAMNTADEAVGVRQLLGGTASGSAFGPTPRVLLVTSAFHMPRSKALFERQGFTVIEYPVDFRVDATSGAPMKYLPSASSLRDADLSIRELLGRLYYALRG
jgi:uncharacterized SAM-binding protein YcdF (DUF218 family)